MKIESGGVKRAGIGVNIARQNIQLFGFVKKVSILTGGGGGEKMLTDVDLWVGEG